MIKTGTERPSPLPATGSPHGGAAFGQANTSPILIVEDHAEVRALLCRALRGTGSPVLEATRCRDALSLAMASQPALIILDRLLPDGSGLDLLRALRASGCGASVLILSALGSSHDKVEGLRAGSDDYLEKPFDMEELLARADALLRRSRAEANPVLRVGGLTLDPVHRQAMWGDVAIPLTRREFEVLLLLMRNPNTVLSREVILQRVWRSNSRASSVVGVYMNYLRRKLRDAGVPPLIETARDRSGYVIRARARAL